jgi:hypothetical protein
MGKHKESAKPKVIKTTSLRDQKNILRWRVPNIATLDRPPFSDRATKKDVDRPRSAPSATTTSSLAGHDRAPRKIPRPLLKTSRPDSIYKRHWMYLYENLHRSVDEMYKNCEQDFSIVECTNVIHTLELCMEDFKRLEAKIQLLSQYDDIPKSGSHSEELPPPSPSSEPVLVASCEKDIHEELPWAERLKRSLEIQKVSVSHIEVCTRSLPTTPTAESHSPPTRQHLLQKLSSPERKKRSPEEAKQLQDERQAKAMKKREELVSAKKEKVALALSRVKEASERHSQLIAKRQLWMDERQEKAGQLHDAHIHHIKRKATVENIKVNEVVWITNQSAETRKFFHKKKLEETEVRRQELAEEKRRKRIEAAAKEEAAAERRKQIEQAKSVPLSPCSSSTESHRKAVMRMCKYCNVEVASAEHLVNHMKGKKHRKAVENAGVNISNTETDCIVTIPSDPSPILAPFNTEEINVICELERNQRKRAKQTKQRIGQLSLSYVEPGIHPPRESPHKLRIVRLVQDLRGLLPKKNFNSMEAVLANISRTLTAKGVLAEVDLQVFRQVGGLELVVNICGTQDPHTPSSILLECLSVLSLSCTQVSNRIYMVMTGRLVPLIDLLGRTVIITPDAPFIPSIITLLTLHLWQTMDNSEQIKEDLVLYIIQTCLFEKLQHRLMHLHSQLDSTNPNPSPASIFVEKTVEFLESVSASIQSK